MKLYPLMLTALVSLGGTALAAPAITTTAVLSIEEEEEADVIGLEAPEIETRSWFNHIGQKPSMAAYRGKVVVVEMWATW